MNAVDNYTRALLEVTEIDATLIKCHNRFIEVSNGKTTQRYCISKTQMQQKEICNTIRDLCFRWVSVHK